MLKKIFPVVLMPVLVVLLFNLVVFSRANAETKSDSMIENALERESLKVGFSTFVPWAMQDKNGEFIGFEVDVARKLAADLGVKLELVPVKWAGILPALLTGQFDIIIGGMSVTTERNLKVNFTVPYDFAGLSLVAHKAKAENLKTLNDFNKAECLIAARTGTSAAFSIKLALPKAKLLLFDEEAQAVQELLNGRVHAFVSGEPLPSAMVLEYPDKLFIPENAEIFAKEPVAFAIRKNDFDSLNVLDNWVRRQESLGWLAERRHYWFKTDEWKDKIK
ncbi:transporter substrate-binding domain-containing protein [Desulfovibrio litoralis]|uniref:Amino acid ABC transporter substrate-binding protein, PAAT family n=1 Tax=Desulfovibrio litoralis DSM 11393 TaxID=1121455 RepID=A0A1M7TKF8_9BACT|nr:transporter substrate-binding domain-containing protein [Desulfovibrio litoralis]SHN71176.1 amino acid ABC transporter substrate-binding protein, PAAT family [Desulfovibrio litoralis DSM 11393]